MYFYALPTRDQAKRVAWEPLKKLVPKEWIVGKPSESELTIRTIFGSTLYLVGMDAPERIEGNQWDGGVIDESCDQKPGSFARSVRPALTHKNGWCWRIGVPKRFGCGAAEFHKFCMDAQILPNHEHYTWPSWDIMSEAEIASVRRELDEKDFNEQFGASWETVSGLVFHAFSPTYNVTDIAVYNPSQPIVVGSDFNVDPMAWVIGHVINRKLHVFDELYVRNTYTQAALDELYRRYGSHQRGFIFFGDATARSRNTRASSSDYAQIVNDKRFIAKVLYPKQNPSRSDRFAACNRMFRNAAGEVGVYIHPRCKNLINDLSTRAYKEGTMEPDDHGDIGHITDAIGYIIHYLFPIITTSPGSAGVSSVEF